MFYVLYMQYACKKQKKGFYRGHGIFPQVPLMEQNIIYIYISFIGKLMIKTIFHFVALIVVQC